MAPIFADNPFGANVTTDPDTDAGQIIASRDTDVDSDSEVIAEIFGVPNANGKSFVFLLPADGHTLYIDAFV